MTSALLKSDSLNFKTGTVVHPTYQFTKQYPQESLGNYTVTNAQGPINTFQLIPNVMNLSKCKLCFTISVPTQGAGNFTWMNVNGLKALTRVTVQPQGGPIIMDVNYIDRYIDTIARKAVSLEHVLAQDSAIPYTVAGTPNGTIFEGLIPNNALGATPIRLDNTSSAKLLESEYLSVTAAANTAYYMDVKIPLSEFVDTILGVDHDLFWKGDNLTITFYYNQLVNYCWLGTSGTNPATGAAIPTVNATIINPYMLVALQQNQELSKSIMDKCMSADGLNLKVPYVYQWSQSIGQGGNNLQTYYNQGQGSHVKKIYWVTYPTTPATPNLIYDKSNLAAAKITTFQSQVNGINVQQFPYNWSWVEDFTGVKNNKYRENWPDVPEENLVDGYPLVAGNMQYNITATSAANLTNYLFTVFLRDLRIASGNITML